MGWLVFIFGLIFGSFFNVVLLRKNTGESMILTGSRCFSCGEKLGALEIVPILSFLWQRGKCRHCGSEISWQYPIVEFLIGLLALIIYLKLTAYSLWLFYFAAFSALFLVAAYDFRRQIIDKHFLYVFAAFAFIKLLHGASGADGLASSFFIALLFYFLWLFSGGKWMGRGDADLAFWISLFAGFPLNIFALLISFWIGGIIGAVLLFNRKFSLKSQIPFGPFLAAAGFLVWYFSDFFLIFRGIIF